ncbi:MAG: hypothetical protein RBJ76_21525 [Stenomitos frigidus ULC029]
MTSQFKAANALELHKEIGKRSLWRIKIVWRFIIILKQVLLTVSAAPAQRIYTLSSCSGR